MANNERVMENTVLAALLSIVSESNMGPDAPNPRFAAVRMKGLERGLSGDLTALADPYTDALLNEVHGEARRVGDAFRLGDAACGGQILFRESDVFDCVCDENGVASLAPLEGEDEDGTQAFVEFFCYADDFKGRNLQIGVKIV